MCKYGNTVALKIKGKTITVDSCISELVKKLNKIGLRTVASCCGHNKRPANIALKDGKEIILCKNYKEARKIDKLWPPIVDKASPSSKAWRLRWVRRN